MQRIDHPDPAAANAQALRRSRKRRDRPDAGLRRLAQRQRLRARRRRRTTLARALDGVMLDAASRIDFNLSPATRNAVQLFAALVKSRKLDAGRRRPARQPQPDRRLGRDRREPACRGANCRKRFAGMIARPRRARLSRPVRGRRRPHHPQCRRLGSAGAGLRARRRASTICARWKRPACRSMRARGMIYFRLAADADQFLTIAKFRAMRKLWARVEEACGLTPKPAFVAAETAWRMMTQRDPYVNMLRTTIAVAAAGLGGADSYHRAAVHRRARPARRFRAARRAQHAAHPARRIQSRDRSPTRPPAPAASRR